MSALHAANDGAPSVSPDARAAAVDAALERMASELLALAGAGVGGALAAIDARMLGTRLCQRVMDRTRATILAGPEEMLAETLDVSGQRAGNA